jgi:hypothetical protein
VALGSIGGRVWHDLCAVETAHQGPVVSAFAGCVQSADGETRADGAFQDGEPPLTGARLLLGLGRCPATTWKETYSRADGTFVFTDIAPGEYCAMASADDQPIQLIPGRWTSPPDPTADNLAFVDVALAPGEVRGGVDFGWDYLFLPREGCGPARGATVFLPRRRPVALRSSASCWRGLRASPGL